MAVVTIEQTRLLTKDSAATTSLRNFTGNVGPVRGLQLPNYRALSSRCGPGGAISNPD
jgi:hypothetical protein